MKARLFAIAGIVHLTVAVLLAATFLFGQPVAVSGEMLGFTSTFTPVSPTDTPIPPTDTPVTTNTPVPIDTPITPEPTGTAVPSAPEPSLTPHLTIVKSASPADVSPGGQVIFTIQVCNDGDGTAASVIASDALPPELVLVSASASQGIVVVEGNGVRADLGALLAGECATVTIVAQVRADVAPGTVIRNVGSVGNIYDDVEITVASLLPESGGVVPLAVAAGLLVMGVGLLVLGAARP